MSEQIKYHNLLTHKKQQIFFTKHDLTKLVFIILSKDNSNTSNFIGRRNILYISNVGNICTDNSHNSVYPQEIFVQIILITLYYIYRKYLYG